MISLFVRQKNGLRISNFQYALLLSLLALLLSGLAACRQPEIESQANHTLITLRRYSTNVGDSFSLFIQLPEEYDAKARTQYPIVYLLDANFYFDMMAPIVRKYAEVGMLPPLILVGVGYRNFKQMDSLRDRDFTYPKTNDSGMSISGGGDKFLAFLEREVMPEVESKFHADTTKRVLAGHSLGGYFTSYALMQHLSKGQLPFTYYIAASPSLDYNHYWLPEKLKHLSGPNSRSKTSLYITYGSLEDAEDSDMPDHVKWELVADQISTLMQTYHVQFKEDFFSNLRHMDTPIPSFIRGLQQALITN